MVRSLSLKFFGLFFIVALIAATGALIPVTAAPAASHTDDITASLPALEEFIQQVAVTGSEQVTGIYVPDHFANQVIQQPASSPGFISSRSSEVTQFIMAARYGVTGLLAHNYLAGGAFFSLEPGMLITLVHGDGSLSQYRVTEVRRYQAITPYSPYSDFIDLANPGTVLTATRLFNDIYTQSGRLVLQTCIAEGSVSSWGRHFILAEPVTQLELLSDPAPVDWGILTATS